MSVAATIKEIVACYRVLAKAISTYERALFYYDETKNPQRDVETKFTYDEFVNVFPEPPSPIPKNPQTYLADLFAYKRWLTYHTVAIYVHAGRALASRHKHVVTLHEELLDKVSHAKLYLIQPRFPIVDRNSVFAAATTHQHFENFKNLAGDLTQKIEANVTPQSWCAYTVEFGLLDQKCRLIIDEIVFLCKRVDDLQGFAHQRRNEFLALIALLIAIGGIFFGTAATIIMPFVTGNNPPVINNVIPTASTAQHTDSLVIEIGKLSERALRLEQMIEKLSAAKSHTEIDFHAALLAEIKTLREAITASNATSADQLKTVLENSEKRVTAALVSIQEQIKQTESAKPDPALLEALKAINESIAALKTAIESRPPPTIIIEDSSKRKHGILNWF